MRFSELISLHGLWLKAAALAAAAMIAVELAADQPDADGPPPLKGPPEEGGVYFLGNSMFGTGLDLSLVREAFEDETVTFGYYNGHYTNMWYAAIRNGLLKSGVRPEVVVWGFRPTYAMRPAFRKNSQTDLDQFVDHDDELFASVLAGANDPVYSLSAGATAGAAARSPILALLENAPGFRARTGVQDGLSRLLVNVGVSAGAPFSDAARQFVGAAQPPRISDLIVSFVTNGQVTRADALVVDNGDRFVRGAVRSFDASFAPLIEGELREARIRQLVILFKPVSAVDGDMPADAREYHERAVSYLEKTGTPYLDFLADDALKKDLYAKRDHYTEEGMAHVTTRIIEKLKQTYPELQ